MESVVHGWQTAVQVSKWSHVCHTCDAFWALLKSQQQHVPHGDTDDTWPAWHLTRMTRDPDDTWGDVKVLELEQ